MANKVFANGREISCKSGQGKSICAFPDVCLSPPSPPAGPVPIPYPNTGMASDTDGGSKKVKISGKEVMLKDKSSFKKSTGDEAATKSLGMGVVTHQIQGKVYFNSWSMDVKIEGENAVRHLDLTTHNHMSKPGNSPPWAHIDGFSGPGKGAIPECDEEVDNKKKACEDKGLVTRQQQCKDPACRKAKRCLLVTYKQGSRDSASTQVGCCDGEQPHHLVEAHCFYQSGHRGDPSKLEVNPPAGKEAYDDGNAPCVCATGPRHAKEHGKYHAFQGALEAAHDVKNGEWTYADARNAGVKANQVINPQCRPGCTAAQLDAYHKNQCGMDEKTKLRTDPEAGTRSAGRLDGNQKKALQAEVSHVQGAKKGIPA